MTITIKRAEGFVEFCTDLGLRAEWEQASDHLDTVRKDTNNMLVDTAVSEAAQAVQDLEARMSASIIVFRVVGLRRVVWDELGATHPPREGVRNDSVLGVDTSTFFDQVAIQSILSVNEKDDAKTPVEFDPAKEWIPLADEMTNGQYNEFVDKFLELNRRSTNVPFSRVASGLMRHSDENSTPPTPSESAASD